ncbi:sensor histidine kinase [Lactococcus termiticola]|uniref:histidine kinase n=1 Tax=Lactococcus termiticola TaxID=2169526 RepID=A0A2R5HH05_9LACT|nr:HAMP domain-containing sensor histidine kinase [Lactococcus termiticola]GBG97347.1 two-component system sensor histidine kinase [Lactococcus termiticola]
MNNKKTKARTSEQLIRRIFRRIVLLMALLNIIAVVSYNIVLVGQSEAHGLMSAMQRYDENELENMEFKTLDGFDEQTNFIRITMPDGDRVTSRGTTEFLSKESFRIGQLMVSRAGVFDYVKMKKDGTTFEVWLSDAVLIRNGMVMLSIMIGIVLLTYFLGLILIRRYSKRLSQPITELASAVKNSDMDLLVPENPTEVRDLAINFNQLIHRLNMKIDQEAQFVSDASHELRTPVTAISGHVNLLKRRWHDHPEIVDESLDYLGAEADRLKTLIEALLSLSRNEQKDPKKEAVKLSDLVEMVNRRLSKVLKQELLIEGEEPGATVTTDPLALQEILTIFLENAGLYSADDDKIILKYNAKEIQVIDRGAGIPDEEKLKIFDRFYRVDKSRSETEGTGLGLAIAEQYAKKNGLRLLVTDNPEGGSVFHILF